MRASRHEHLHALTNTQTHMRTHMRISLLKFGYSPSVMCLSKLSNHFVIKHGCHTICTTTRTSILISLSIIAGVHLFIIDDMHCVIVTSQRNLEISMNKTTFYSTFIFKQRIWILNSYSQQCIYSLGCHTCTF